MNRLPKVTQLRNLRAIITSGSIRSAAIATHQTQSAMTRSIQELEQIVGAPVLVRRSSGVELTDIGRILEPKMNLILNELERAIDDVKQIVNASNGTIVFGCSHLPAFGVMTEVIKKFQERFPFTQITIIEGQFSELVSSIRVGRLDFYIGMTSPGIALEGFDEEPLCESRFYVFARKDHALIKSQSLIELRNSKWYIPGSGASMFSSLENIIFPYGRGPQCSVLYGDSVTVAQQLILKEHYFSIGPKEIINSSWIKGKLAILKLSEDLPAGRFSIIRRADTPIAEVTQWLIDEVRREFIKFSHRND
ncbi:LysR substrate-binding domain-containing protein [Lelliottia nimipressuralis]